MTKMNPEVKAKWVAALRSGEYKQGRGMLRSKINEFCCLGVLCNLHAQDHPVIASKQKVPTVYMGDNGLLPEGVETWARTLNKWGGTVFINGKSEALTWHNDMGCTFAEIADAIEAQL